MARISRKLIVIWQHRGEEHTASKDNFRTVGRGKQHRGIHITITDSPYEFNRQFPSEARKLAKRNATELSSIYLSIFSTELKLFQRRIIRCTIGNLQPNIRRRQQKVHRTSRKQNVESIEQETKRKRQWKQDRCRRLQNGR